MTAPRATYLALSLCLGALLSCRSESGGASTTASASASAIASALGPTEVTKGRAQQLLVAEHRGDSSAVRDDDLTSRDVIVRRRAARALARTGDGRAHKLLLAALSDEDPSVVAWSAYGLGQSCDGAELETVRRLVVRAASLGSAPPRPPHTLPRLDPMAAIADALGRCDAPEAERTLRGWLDRPGARSEQAALALGRLATRRGRLEEASVVALLDAASRPKDPTRNAIYPFTRLGALGGGIQARLAAIAREALGQTSSVRRFAVRALGRSGPEAVGTLSGVVIGETFSPSERADAARELAKHGPRGQEQLRKALAHLTRPDSLTRERLLSAHFGPLITVLQALEPPAGSARDDLSRLAELALPVADAAALRRRIVALRCRAAALLAGSSSLSARLVSCDPVKDGRIGALAMLEVLDRGALVGARFRRWSSLVDSPDPVVRQSALRLMSAHPEIEAPHRILGRALTSKNPGTVAAAAEVLAAYPDRAAADAKTRQAKAAPPSSIEGARTLKPDTAVMSALATGYKTLPEDAIEARVALLDAASALQLLSLKPALETACKSENGTLREHAERGLRLLGDKTRRCNEFFPADSAPAEVEMHLPTRVRLEFDTDVGPLHLELDPELAPVSVARIVRLAERGFYDGLVVHRVVPGFVAQFGDPDGDGYGGTHEGLLRSEGSPAQFGTWSVGLALSGRDTGSSQLFVTLGPFPHLDGDYPLLGQANDSWEKLAQGDVIRKVRVSR